MKNKRHKKLSKKKQRALHLDSWSRQAHKRDKIYELKNKEFISLYLYK